MTLPLVWLHGPPARSYTEDLRWSIRSVTANLPHTQVWIAGWAPTWVNRDLVHVIDVEHDPRAGKHAATTANLRAAAAAIPGPFLLLNDDFFLTRPASTVAPAHRGPLAAQIERIEGGRPGAAWAALHRATLEVLAGFGVADPLSYELHRPMQLHGAAMAYLLDEVGDRLVAKRSLYGNAAKVGGELVDDVKVYDDATPLPDTEWVSTLNQPFRRGLVGQQLRGLFPAASRYERRG